MLKNYARKWYKVIYSFSKATNFQLTKFRLNKYICVDNNWLYIHFPKTLSTFVDGNKI